MEISDPFDLQWTAEDPKGREVVMLRSIIEARRKAGKHPGPPDHLDPDEARKVIEEPTRIDETSRSKTSSTFNYYKISEDEPNPYARVTVRFKAGDNRGLAISWSRYNRPASLLDIDWPED